MMNTETTDSQTLEKRVLSGSFVLLTGLGLVAAINFTYNIAVARFLGPTGFGQASAVYTLLILMSAVTLSFQIVSAKVVAQQDSIEAKGAAYRGFHRQAWACGILTGIGLVLLRGVVSEYLNLTSPTLVVWLAVGVTFYVPLGSKRGYLQGAYGFRHLATNLVLEGSVRLFGSLVLIQMGLGVEGVIIATAAAVAIAYLFAVPSMPRAASVDVHIPDAFREALQAIVFFVGQVIINNCDIVLVKHFFPPASAGLYAAVALVGRAVFAFSWAVVNTMFPIVAGTRTETRKRRGVLAVSLLLVFAIGSIFTLGVRLAPPGIWTLLFGSQFAAAGGYGISRLLVLYAITTGVYSLSVVMIAYEMSYKIANTGWMQLSLSGVLIASIYLFHSSLQQVIWVQMIMMGFLLIVVSVPFLLSRFNPAEPVEQLGTIDGLRVIRRVSEDEVITAFLKSEIHNPEFELYRESTLALLNAPDFTDADQNARRRALLFIRHDSLWRELPRSTEWVELEVQAPDLARIRVFPRAQWRKLARGDFSLSEIARTVSSGHHLAGDAFFSKIADIRRWLAADGEPGPVLLIGISNRGPFTILDGNHRLLAASLTSPEAVQRLTFFCGLSPQMAECCWYETNVATLLRYGKNLLTHLAHDPEEELVRVLGNSSSSSSC